MSLDQIVDLEFAERLELPVGSMSFVRHQSCQTRNVHALHVVRLDVAYQIAEVEGLIEKGRHPRSSSP
jgi:hypothetical protein